MLIINLDQVCGLDHYVDVFPITTTKELDISKVRLGCDDPSIFTGLTAEMDWYNDLDELG